MRITKLPWGEIFTDLEKAGQVDYKVYKVLGVARETYRRWREGTEPKESVGRAILEIHTTHCGQDKTNQRISEAR